MSEGGSPPPPPPEDGRQIPGGSGGQRCGGRRSEQEPDPLEPAVMSNVLASLVGGDDQPGDEWCQRCRSLRQELSQVRSEHTLNYATLKEKIISTDQLIMRYKSKCQEYDIQAKQLEETDKKLEKYMRDCELYEARLRANLQDEKPMKKAKDALEAAQKLHTAKMTQLEDKLRASEAGKQQYVSAHAIQEELLSTTKKDLEEEKKRLKEIESSNKKEKKQILKLQADLAVKKKDLVEQKKTVASARQEREKHEERANWFETVLSRHGLLQQAMRTAPKGLKRWMSLRHKSPVSMDTDQDNDSSDEDLLLEKLFGDEEESSAGFNLFKPLAHALSPLPPSPPVFESHDPGCDGETESDNESIGDIADQLESQLLRSSPRLKQRTEQLESEQHAQRPGQDPELGRSPKGAEKKRRHHLLREKRDIARGHVHTRGQQSSGVGENQEQKSRFVESGLSKKGVLVVQESLSDPENDLGSDMPFQGFSHKGKCQNVDLYSDLDLSNSGSSDSDSDMTRSRKSPVGRRTSPRLAAAEKRLARVTNSGPSPVSPPSEVKSKGVPYAQPARTIQNQSPFKEPLPVSPRRGRRKTLSVSSVEDTEPVTGSHGNQTGLSPRRITRSASCPAGILGTGVPKDSIETVRENIEGLTKTVGKSTSPPAKQSKLTGNDSLQNDKSAGHSPRILRSNCVKSEEVCEKIDKQEKRRSPRLKSGNTNSPKSEIQLAKVKGYSGFVTGETLYFGTLAVSDGKRTREESPTENIKSTKLHTIHGISPLSRSRRLSSDPDWPQETDSTPGEGEGVGLKATTEREEEEKEGVEEEEAEVEGSGVNRHSHRPLAKSSSTGFTKQISDEYQVFVDGTDGLDTLGNQPGCHGDSLGGLDDASVSVCGLGDGEVPSDETSTCEGGFGDQGMMDKLGDHQVSQELSQSDRQVIHGEQKNGQGEQQVRQGGQKDGQNDQEVRQGDQQVGQGDQQVGQGDQQVEQGDQQVKDSRDGQGEIQDLHGEQNNGQDDTQVRQVDQLVIQMDNQNDDGDNQDDHGDNQDGHAHNQDRHGDNQNNHGDNQDRHGYNQGGKEGSQDCKDDLLVRIEGVQTKREQRMQRQNQKTKKHAFTTDITDTEPVQTGTLKRVSFSLTDKYSVDVNNEKNNQNTETVPAEIKVAESDASMPKSKTVSGVSKEECAPCDANELTSEDDLKKKFDDRQLRELTLELSDTQRQDPGLRREGKDQPNNGDPSPTRGTGTSLNVSPDTTGETAEKLNTGSEKPPVDRGALGSSDAQVSEPLGSVRRLRHPLRHSSSVAVSVFPTRGRAVLQRQLSVDIDMTNRETRHQGSGFKSCTKDLVKDQTLASVRDTPELKPGGAARGTKVEVSSNLEDKTKNQKSAPTVSGQPQVDDDEGIQCQKKENRKGEVAKSGAGVDDRLVTPRSAALEGSVGKSHGALEKGDELASPQMDIGEPALDKGTGNHQIQQESLEEKEKKERSDGSQESSAAVVENNGSSAMEGHVIDVRCIKTGPDTEMAMLGTADSKPADVVVTPTGQGHTGGPGASAAAAVRPTTLAYRPAGKHTSYKKAPVTVVSPETSGAPGVESVTSGRSDTPSNVLTPVFSEGQSPMSSLPSSPMPEKVETITPISPLPPSDHSEALSPLSFSLSDTEEIGEPISPLPPSPVPHSRHDSPEPVHDSLDNSHCFISPIEEPSAPRSTYVPRPGCSGNTSSHPVHAPIPRHTRNTAPSTAKGKATPGLASKRSKTIQNKSTKQQTRRKTASVLESAPKDVKLSQEDEDDDIPLPPQPGKVRFENSKVERRTSLDLNRINQLKSSSSSQSQPSGQKTSVQLGSGMDEVQSPMVIPKRRGRPLKRKSPDAPSSTAVVPKKQMCPAPTSNELKGSTSNPAMIRSMERELQQFLRQSSTPVQTVANRLLKFAVAGNKSPVVEAVLKLLRSQEIDLLTTLYTKCSQRSYEASWTPFMADLESKVTQLLLILQNTKQLSGVIDMFLSEAENMVKRKDNTSVLVRTSLCRVCTAVCRQKGLVGRMRVLLYDIVISQCLGFPTLVVGIASVWPDLLRPTLAQVPQMLNRVMEYTIMSKVAGQKLRHNKMCTCLKVLCQWLPPRSDTSATQLVTQVLDHLKVETNKPSPSIDSVLELECCVALVASSEDWAWTNNVLIVEVMWALLQTWAATKTGGSSGISADGVSDLMVVSILRIMGGVVSRCPAIHMEAAKDVMTKLQLMVTGVPGATIPKDVQMAALQSLLNLAPFDPSLVVEIAEQWLDQPENADLASQEKRRKKTRKVQDHAQQELLKHIHSFLNMYKPVLASAKLKDKLT